jgi:ATP-binding cassette subfamily C protein
MTEAVSRPAAALPNASAEERVTPKSAARKLYEIFTPRERVQAGFLFLGNLFAAFAQVIGVAVIFPFINVAMNPQVINENKWLDALYKKGAFADSNSFIVFLGTVVFVAIIASSLAPAAVSWAQTRFLLKKEHAISLRLLAVYLSRPYQYFLSKNTSELGKNVLSEVGGLTMGMLTALFELLIQGTLLVVLICMLLFVDVLVTVGAMLVLGGGYALLSFLIKTKLQKSGKERLTANAARYRYATGALSGIKTTRVMGIERYFLNSYADNSLTYARLQIFASLAGTLPRYFLETIAFGGIVLFLVLRLAAGGSIAELIPLVSLYAFSAYRMTPALYRLYFAATQLHYYQAVLDKIYTDMLDAKTDEESASDDASLPFDRAIRLEGIDFRYTDAQTDVIRGLDITIPKNTSIGFVGATGSGKTTLVDIILGLLVPQQGRILVDDTPHH